MSDDVVHYSGVLLRGEKISIGSPTPAPTSLSVRDAAAAGRDFIGIVTTSLARLAPAFWPAVSVCGVVALWGAPALLLSRHSPAQLFDALVRVALKPTGGELLTLFLVLTYLVLTGLMLGKVAPIPRRKSLRVLLRLAIAPLVTLSLVATLTAAVPLLFGALVMCFPGLV